jgi:hypothetical protein
VNIDPVRPPKVNLLALLRRERTKVRVALLLGAMLAVTLSACGKSPDKSASNRQAASSVQGDRELFINTNTKSSQPPKKSPVPVLSAEEPAWLTEALKDPDPTVRLNAIEAWARNPGASLDPLTHALVDPDESVRTRAQELLEDALARR